MLLHVTPSPVSKKKLLFESLTCERRRPTTQALPSCSSQRRTVKREMKEEETQATLSWEWAVTCGLHSHLTIGVLGQSPPCSYYGPVGLSREMRDRSGFWPGTPCKSSRELYSSRKSLARCLPAGELKSFTRAKEQGGGRDGDDEEVAGGGVSAGE